MRIGVDLGGTKIETIVIDENGNELWRRRVATPVENYDEILGAIRNLVLAAENELSKKGCRRNRIPGDPDIIVLGGGLSNIDEIYHDLINVIKEFAFTDALNTAIARACHGDSSGVRGAACLWPATFG